ncbi:circularly permuted type 2 ATP-grasp protein [Acidithiobacillus sp. CV18-2]|uniref:Circularly permuted type 2 ATP-grasp protein n=1 Tax=Igneacidithiobacillus copahuensis TaxID=2724909 RepID=A0AAE3CKB8_9PROT|nr:circularly permuted type 2 ATP-grasp protein [Igneacidithiobacillus copahuensis]MBU2753240.1 circularly permuted type 2 ATP-grasp protein [Acidithiobacillus sp. CV18-3]MBU2757934.1 circularly permuted type 2 ATP-grasp protein [Acidithiobacillus sp. BN09-2]MBU2777743.1 circularly permuted type 2 ATP-grasp protein [Acidithiobacillus sp. CV18-2]MBU2796782.1 circularly permuted type 2 ATP-grasp protein [Acidithiobacillus sp. VAN18-2]MBU2800468.1 circularly permuted type 2 ATP-grasp protein [Aci
MQKILYAYPEGSSYDELLTAAGKPRAVAKALLEHFEKLGPEALRQRQETADTAIRAMGITFTVYSEAGNIDRSWPFDIVPRTLSAREWTQIEAGLRQRLKALNHFIDDIYNEQRVLDDNVFPREILEGSRNFRAACRGVHPRFGAWANICGSDLVRDADGTVYVLEDNLRVPSGVSYMLENRAIMKRLFPEIFAMCSILPVDDYPAQLASMLADLSPRPSDKPVIAVLTPGIYNSAYFEHSYLAQQMGAYLAEGTDFLVDSEDRVFLRTISGLLQVDVIYRRVDDDFLDPEVFRDDSVIGVSGLMRAWKRGTVAIANAPGTGVADDKVVYAFVPEFIRYYLKEEPILPNVPTYLCLRDADREYVLAHLDELVVKPANESGGYGMLIGPRASVEERQRFAERIREDPRNYIAQPTLSLSTAPTLIGDHLEPRHLDLRPFILQAKDSYVTTGGLTRVAMNAGSLVVNSSQGGGSKDTWIVEEDV